MPRARVRCIFLGVLLDGKFGGGGIFIVGGIVLGIVAGLLAAYKMLVPYTRQP